MNKFRLTFDIEIPNISEDDNQEIGDWLNHFIGCVEDDIYSCCPYGGMNVSSDWKKLK
jgi:hypothetical protein